MSTRTQIRTQVRSLVNDTDSANSHFSDAELNDFIDQGVRYLGSLIEYPRTFYEVQVTVNTGSYTLPADTQYLRTAYFGDKTIAGDIMPLTIMSEETLKEIKRNWRETNTTNSGRPERLIILDRTTAYIDPPPDAASAATSKKLHLGYVQVPAALSSDSSTPDLPTPYHDVVQFYAAHLAHFKKENPALAAAMLGTMNEKMNALKPVVTRESKEGYGWQWGYQDNLDDNFDWGIIP